MNGLCRCGCGQRTALAVKTDRSKGWVKGQPLPYAGRGHNATVTNRPRRVLSESDYEVRDCGFETPCHIWTGAVRGHYGKVGINGRYVPAHVAFYERDVGSVPPGHELHHRCEQKLCVRSSHVTPLLRDEHMHGHRRLTVEQARAIRGDSRRQVDIAAAYGISQQAVSDVRRGRSYADA